MPIGGINLSLSIGRNQPKPAPRLLMEALQSVEVTQKDEGRSGFQIVFQVGRSGSSALQDYQLLKSPLLKPFNRAILSITIGATAQLLIDGIVTNQQLSPSMEPGMSTLTITGEDVSIMMDLEEKSVAHPQQNPKTIVERIISDSKYSKYGLSLEAEDPYKTSRPSQKDWVPVQQGTDLSYIKLLAQRYAYVFYITPGPRSGRNTAYWGPPKRGRGSPIQRALSVNMGSFTNLESLNFQHDALAATEVSGQLQDRQTNEIKPVKQSTSTRPLLATQSPLRPGNRSQPQVRMTKFRQTGRTMTQAQTRTQAMLDRSADHVVTVSGELDTVRYGDLLQLRGLVGLRGVGLNYDGLYYVKSVTHKIQVRSQEYKQSFTITREGIGSTVEQLSV